MMRDIIINTAKTLYDPDESDMTEKIDSGAFAGLNMWEAMLISKTTDVKAFLRYVIDYPHKYMGRKFRIDESYATWVINFTPTNEDDGNLLSKLYKEIVTDADWENWESAYGRYLKVTAFDFSQVQTNIYAVANQGNLDSAIKLVDQWSALTTKYNYRQEYRDFELIRAWVFQTKKQYSVPYLVRLDPGGYVWCMELPLPGPQRPGLMRRSNICCAENMFSAKIQGLQYLVLKTWFPAHTRLFRRYYLPCAICAGPV